MWRDLQNTVGYEFDGGNVTFNGIMNGSIAIYTTHGDYLVSGGQTFHTTCHNNGWIHLPTIDIAGNKFFISIASCTCTQSLPSLCIECSLADLSPSLDDVNRLCRSFSGGVVCYSGDRVGSEAVYFCDDGYRLEGDTTRQCLLSGHWNGTTALCAPETSNINNVYFMHDFHS